MRGGFPEVVTALAPNRRAAWFEAYVTTVLHREVQELARIEGLTTLPRLLQLVAARPMALLNYADLSRSCGIPQTTLKRYLALFEALFLVRTLSPWHSNIGKRLIKTPKLFLTDTGLASFLLGLDAARLQRDHTLYGPLLENFVVMELTKQLSWHPDPPSMYFFRVHEGPQVDFVLEQRSATLVGIEVKASTTVGPGDFRGLQVLALAAGRRFHRGIVLYIHWQRGLTVCQQFVRDSARVSLDLEREAQSARAAAPGSSYKNQTEAAQVFDRTVANRDHPVRGFPRTWGYNP